MSSYDSWLLQQADDYMTGCEPTAGRPFRDEHGYIDVEYNCQNCDDRECEHWKEFNND